MPDGWRYSKTNLLRRVFAKTEWTSSSVKRNAITRLSTILTAATREGLLAKNPVELIACRSA
ncbi:hypothetical protein [Pseudomonas sp. CM25]|uniref:hypothetical protein n=1 Tax=Pseudomonas sp. CM25 TaxID=2738448 RepID=UPI0015B6A7F8|nr:hypothetical protein [Pseudomonas sp. CM25]HEN8799269.1 hypothetical protein [Pseudomonas putida]